MPALEEICDYDDSNHDEPPVLPWSGGPPRLWSLWDMERFLFLHFLSFIRRLDEEATKAAKRIPAEQVPEPGRMELAGVVQALREQCVDIGLLKQSPVFSLTVNKLISGCSFELLSTRLLDLRFAVIQALSEQQFAFIPAARSACFEQDALFGENVAKAFRSAAADIKGAGNCFASGLYTATVFHLMRAVEIALRVLARDLKIEFHEPLEFQEWATLIDKIQAEANEFCDKRIQGRKAKTEARDFYNGAIGEFRAFKDAWRNHVMHTRESYDMDLAQSVMNHVREFMQRLSRRLSESRRTSLRWK
ncbi:MAG TPA: hypothetical protein VHR45_02170 [Thermoanaerobaculia bacterium]|nr:hypothetical protein [Thermoanaerobaculia bacterium]